VVLRASWPFAPRMRTLVICAARVHLLAFGSSAPAHREHGRRQAGPLHLDLRRGLVDLVNVFGCERDSERPEVLVQAFEFRGARDGHDPWLLRQEPGERYLRRRRALTLGPFADDI